MDLPCSERAEKAALGCVLVKPIALAALDAELPRGAEEFFFPVHREIYEAMRAVADRKMPVDIVSLSDELRQRDALRRMPNGEAYLVELANAAPTAENVLGYARTVRQKARLRMLIATCAEVQGRAAGNVGDPDEFMAEAVGKFGKLAGVGDRRAPTLSETLSEVLDDIDRAEAGHVVPLVPTGIPKLDRLLGGGLAEEWLVVPAALTSIGKTSWALDVAVKAAKIGIPSLIFSLEQSRRELAIKIAALAGKVPTSAFRHRGGQVVDRKAVIDGSTAASRIAHLITIEDHRNIGQIVMVATAWRAQHPGPGLIVVDYLQRVAGYRARGEREDQEIAGVAKALKSLARELKLPVIAPGQCDNDAAKNQRAPRIGDLAGSKVIEREADVILGIHRNRLVKRGPCELILLKYRHGSVGKATATWVGEYQGFEEPDGDDPGNDDDQREGDTSWA